MATKPKTPAVNWDSLDVGIEHIGRKITLPAEPGAMPLRTAAKALLRKAEDEEQTFSVHETIDAYPLDAAVAFVKAMTNLYGWASPKATPGFYGPRNPQMISVKVGPKDEDVIQCPIGAFQLPGIDEPVNTHVDDADFIIYGDVKKKDKHFLLELANETRRIVREESIYKGKPIRMRVNDDGELEMKRPPEFLDVSDTSEASVLFDSDIQAQVDVNVLVPIKHTTACRKQRIPLKRGVLLAGPFGTGKTLLSRVIAKVAQDHGWTFILLDRVQGLRTALEFATRYAPAIVQAEDIDRIAEERDDRMNDLVNVIDGVVSKRSEIMTILTTNFAEKLDPVILRPGRLDAIITLRAPNAETVQRLLRHYAGSLIVSGTDLSNAGLELAGQIPAAIRECVERAKLAMIGRGDDKLVDSDLVVAAQTMKNHLMLLNRRAEEQSVADKLAASLKEVIGNGNARHLESNARHLESIESSLERLEDRLS